MRCTLHETKYSQLNQCEIYNWMLSVIQVPITLYLQIVHQSNWLPDPVSPAHGMELEKLSFLGPFFSLSVFAEDNVSPEYIVFVCTFHLANNIYTVWAKRSIQRSPYTASELNTVTSR